MRIDNRPASYRNDSAATGYSAYYSSVVGYTASFWSAQAATYVSPDSAKEMVGNVSGFIAILAAWAATATASYSPYAGEVNAVGNPSTYMGTCVPGDGEQPSGALVYASLPTLSASVLGPATAMTKETFRR